MTIDNEAGRATGRLDGEPSERDTCGLLLAVLVHRGSRAGPQRARLLLHAPRTCFPTIKLVWAGAATEGPIERGPGGNFIDNGQRAWLMV